MQNVAYFCFSATAYFLFCVGSQIVSMDVGCFKRKRSSGVNADIRYGSLLVVDVSSKKMIQPFQIQPHGHFCGIHLLSLTSGVCDTATWRVFRERMQP